MRVAVISDVHANLEALKRVLQFIDNHSVDALWCLGDIVGYGPEPEACVEILREQATIVLAGNHDLAVVGKIPLEAFNPVASEAILWQRQRLSQASKTWLATLSPRIDLSEITLAHGSPRSPIWEYVDRPEIALDNYDAFDSSICLIGHSHLALAWRLLQSQGERKAMLATVAPGEALALGEQDKWLLNPGSVGQPRDHDPRASFAILDWEGRRWTWYRLTYDIESVESAIIQAGLPTMLGRRLFLGW